MLKTALKDEWLTLFVYPYLFTPFQAKQTDLITFSLVLLSSFMERKKYILNVVLLDNNLLIKGLRSLHHPTQAVNQWQIYDIR